MPRGNRTGPDGRGPMTGRRAGYCSGQAEPASQNSMPGRGRGRGRGWRNSFQATGLPGWLRWGVQVLAPPQKEIAREDIQDLRQQLADAQARLDALENETRNPE